MNVDELAAQEKKLARTALHCMLMEVRIAEHRLAEMRYRIACAKCGINPDGEPENAP